MNRSVLLVVILLAALAAALLIAGQAEKNVQSAPSSDRIELPRTPGPGKEPPYTVRPAYCQLAFGPLADVRIWLVESGPLLYVDLDSDGELSALESVPGSTVNGSHTHRGVELIVGSKRYTLSHERQADGTVLTVADPEGRKWRAHGDEAGELRFSIRVKDAPIVHFDGVLQMGFESLGAVMRRRNGKTRISAAVGCYGRGPGCFAHLLLTSIPDVAVPAATISLPLAGQPEGQPTVIEARLSQRC